MRILLDVDGVLADWHGHLVNSVNHACGSRVSPDQITEFHCVEQLHDLVVQDLKDNPARCQVLDSDDVFNTISWLAHESEWFYQTLPVIPGTREAVARMRRAGNEVFFVTSPILTMRSWVHTRTQWLKRHFDALEQDMVFTKSKHVVCGDVLVDDKPENVLEWAKTGHGVAYLLLKPYNSPILGHENIGFISSLDSVR